MSSRQRRSAALAAIVVSLAASSCSQQPTEVVAGAGGLQSEVVSSGGAATEDTATDGTATDEAPSTTQPQGDDDIETTTMPPLPTTVAVTNSSARTAACAALETFLLEDLPELDDATMATCAIPFFGAVFALEPVSMRFCEVSNTIDGDDASIDDSDCSTTSPTPSMPCFAPVEPDIDVYHVTSYAAVDCDTGELIPPTHRRPSLPPSS